jgi:hypothetical protein
MKTLIASLAAIASTAAFAHDSTMPHVHPHGASFLPDYAAMLLAAALVAGGVIAVRLWRKG